MRVMSRLALLLTLVAALVAGCGGEAREADAPPPDVTGVVTPPADTTTSAQHESPPVRCEAGTTRSYESRGVAAVVRRPTPAFRTPGRGVVERFGLRNVNGVPTTFRVLEARLGADCRPTWYRVQLPIRPNGAEGWVAASAVRRYTVAFRIVVDLSDRMVTVYHEGDVLVRTRTAIGLPETPTPTGRYYVNQRLLASDPTGPWGPGGIGISAFSPTLVDWAQGGPIAIHGTNQPESIGEVMSNGCLRIQNAVLERLLHVVPDGTPVRIRA